MLQIYEISANYRRECKKKINILDKNPPAEGGKVGAMVRGRGGMVLGDYSGLSVSMLIGVQGQADSSGSNAELLTFQTNLSDFFLCPLLPFVLLADGLAEGGDNLVACAVLECYLNRGDRFIDSH